jgi:hypothetical protein
MRVAGIIGAWQRPEFADVVAAVRALPGVQQPLLMADTLNRAVDSWAREPQLVIVCQSWSDEYTSAEILSLYRRWPLSRVVCVAGAWCAADGRTRQAWPLALRVMCWGAAERVAREWHGLPATRLPWTATREEIVLFDYGGDSRNSGAGRSAVMVLADRAYAETASAMLRSAGWSTAVYRSPSAAASHTDATVAVMDLEPWSDERLCDVRRLAQRWPVVGLAAFPTCEFVDEVTAAGVRAVVPKLAPCERLLRTLSLVNGQSAVAKPADPTARAAATAQSASTR